ncbi:GAF domain-containing protein [Henriciella barbarensis]|uniref:GAF domain-containing protein n=1 Tax=Henriciella barbarensis TaxID=86342 RepID=A0A399R4W7_9PROT|nr:GAF domain-containing protein [Henriciella barbarensis]
MRRQQILDTAPSQAFDAISRAAARHFDVPIVLVSLVDANRQWFKSCVGIDACESDRTNSFCSYAIQTNDVFVVEDARQDPRFKDHGMVTAEPYIRFYAGAPINVDGYNIGTFCIIDHKPRPLSPEQQADLTRMATLVRRQIKLDARMAGRDPVSSVTQDQK